MEASGLARGASPVSDRTGDGARRLALDSGMEPEQLPGGLPGGPGISESRFRARRFHRLGRGEHMDGHLGSRAVPRRESARLKMDKHKKRPEKHISTPKAFRSPLAYENPAFIHGPDGRSLRILAEYWEPVARFRKERGQDSVVFCGWA